MKKLITTLTLLLMFSSPSYAELTKMDEDVMGNRHYVDFDRIRKVDGHVYFWQLTDLLKPNSDGDFKLFRVKVLSRSTHTQPMGEGTPSAYSNKLNEKWAYLTPKSALEISLNAVCKRFILCKSLYE